MKHLLLQIICYGGASGLIGFAAFGAWCLYAEWCRDNGAPLWWPLMPAGILAVFLAWGYCWHLLAIS